MVARDEGVNTYGNKPPVPDYGGIVKTVKAWPVFAVRKELP